MPQIYSRPPWACRGAFGEMPARLVSVWCIAGIRAHRLSRTPTHGFSMSTTASRNNLIGMLSLSAGALVFSLQDSVIKGISGEHAVTLAIVLRAVVSFPILTVMVMMNGGIGQLDTPHWRMLVVRGAILLCAYTTYFMAFPALPLAQAIALYFTVPLIVTVMSGPVLGERVAPAAWGAVALGLVGVFVILQPGIGIFNPAALLSLVSAATYALAMVLARKHGENIPSSVMAFYANVVYMLLALVLAVVVMAFNVVPPGHPSLDFLLRHWFVPSPFDMGLMAVCGVIAAFGSTLLVHAYRIGQSSVVAPFEYTGMVWAVAFGFLFFGEVPKPATIIGMAMIALAGFLALRANSARATGNV